MAKNRPVNVWFDRPGDFLEIHWGDAICLDAISPSSTEFELCLHLSKENHVNGFDMIGPVIGTECCTEKALVMADVQPHPVTIKYNRPADQWDIQWGPDAVECVDTSNPRIKARADADGDIQGVLISDLRTFEDEILNQDIYPVKPGATAP